jgi:hypothetical protein
MPVKPFWLRLGGLLESAGCDLPGATISYTHQCSTWGVVNALHIRNDVVSPKPKFVVRLGVAVAATVAAALGPGFEGPRAAARLALLGDIALTLKGRGVGAWYCYAGAWVARDPFIAPDAIQIDMVVKGQILRDVKPTQYAVGELLRTVNYYVSEATK